MFENLKIMFYIIFILVLFNPEENCIVKVNSSNHIFIEVLS